MSTRGHFLDHIFSTRPYPVTGLRTEQTEIEHPWGKKKEKKRKQHGDVKSLFFVILLRNMYLYIGDQRFDSRCLKLYLMNRTHRDKKKTLK